MRKIIFQGLDSTTQAQWVGEVLALANAKEILLSTAFLTKSGVELIGGSILNAAVKPTLVVGIRNGVTTYQGVIEALGLGCRVWAFDTGLAHRIFHPKFFYAQSDYSVRYLVGSANITRGGMTSNLEAGVYIDSSDQEDFELVSDYNAVLTGVRSNHPQNLYEIVDFRSAHDLLIAGVLVDESVPSTPTIVGQSNNKALDPTPILPIPILNPAPHHTVSPPPSTSQTMVAPSTEIVWTSNPLTRRYLCIPEATGSNPTGSMLFTKGMVSGIDQRHYFREQVFASLNWAPDPNPSKAHLERSEAFFNIIVKGVCYGNYRLRLTHNSNVASKSYVQNNAMTQLHWGKALSFIAREDLIGTCLTLYRHPQNAEQFDIAIG